MAPSEPVRAGGGQNGADGCILECTSESGPVKMGVGTAGRCVSAHAETVRTVSSNLSPVKTGAAAQNGVPQANGAGERARERDWSLCKWPQGTDGKRPSNGL